MLSISTEGPAVLRVRREVTRESFSGLARHPGPELHVTGYTRATSCCPPSDTLCTVDSRRSLLTHVLAQEAASTHCRLTASCPPRMRPEATQVLAAWREKG